ncbi:MAG TPA: TIGR01458 family HAD-type hydrolase [Longimicrobiaceae bacterium]|nr:TIGR01458 family HAD-type hydrolase [Longimicrobiaceae bacterium]
MRPDALLFDLDGTLYQGDAALPGAVDALRRLDALGVPRRFLTNTTRFSRRELAGRLRRMGFSVADAELFTAPVAAVRWLEAHGIRRVSLCLPRGSWDEFVSFDRVEDAPEAVVVGDLGEEWSFERLNRAFRALLDGARLVALQRNRYWMTPGGLSLDAGPFVAALEFAARTSAVVVGKPAPEFFRLAASSFGPDAGRIVVVGDDVEADVGGAQRAGLGGALVRTGKFRQEELERSEARPDEIGDSAADLIERWFGRAS